MNSLWASLANFFGMAMIVVDFSRRRQRLVPGGDQRWWWGPMRARQHLLSTLPAVCLVLQPFWGSLSWALLSHHDPIESSSAIQVKLPVAYTEDCVPVNHFYIPTCVSVKLWSLLTEMADVILPWGANDNNSQDTTANNYRNITENTIANSVLLRL